MSDQIEEDSREKVERLRKELIAAVTMHEKIKVACHGVWVGLTIAMVTAELLDGDWLLFVILAPLLVLNLYFGVRAIKEGSNV